MTNTETRTQWGLKWPNGDIQWDDPFRPIYRSEGRRMEEMRDNANLAIQLHRDIDSLPIWIAREVRVSFGEEIEEHDDRELTVGHIFRNHEANRQVTGP